MRTARDQFRIDLRALAHGRDHFANWHNRIPGFIGAAAAALEKSVVTLDLTDFAFRIKLDKLRVLVRREDVEIFSRQNRIEILVRCAQRRCLRGV